MSVMRWQGTATALTSVAHGQESLGTVRYLRRERVLMPDGSVEDLPVVSGNAFRGMLRRTAADLWWDAVGQPKLTMPVMHAIWAGGALAKSNGSPLTGSRLALVREICPVVGLFGTAGGGRIIDGCVQVGKLIPVCAEAAHLLPMERTDGRVLPSVWDLTQIEYYTQLPVTERMSEQYTDGDEEKVSPMRYGTETFLAGTVFDTWLSASWATPRELSFLGEVLAAFKDNARVGGQSRAGHGRLRLDLSSDEQVPAPEVWRDTLPPVDVKFLEALAWLD